MRRYFLSPLVLFCLFSQRIHSAEYAVMIDAGSTGSRVLVYEIGKRQAIKVVDQLKIGPGLATFESNLSAMAPYLQELLEFAKQQLPGDTLLSDVTLVLQATGGVRALPELAQKSVIHEAQQVLLRSGFKEPRAEIISGETEGVYQWMAIKYLSGSAVGLVEMGGASLQVTFEQGALYSRTYDGLGLERARRELEADPCLATPFQYDACREALLKQLSLVERVELKGEFYLVDHFEKLASLLGLKTLSSQTLDVIGRSNCWDTGVAFQIAYSSAVLEAVGFERTRELLAVKEINGTPLSWTLGSLIVTRQPVSKPITKIHGESGCGWKGERIE